jgi:pimeloyl-ACP methyl ester carboxylesterase
MAASTTYDIEEVTIGPNGLAGLLGVPDAARGIVVFAHGSGSGRLSPRNNHVAAALRRAGLATLLLDLLTPAEEQDRRNVFDIGLLASRLALATRWAAADKRTENLIPLYFGASTGAAAALTAASYPDAQVAAIVSRGGRPDLAMDALAAVRAPTLLLVGSLDGAVIEMNQRALHALRVEKQLVLIKGATHLFEEPGTLDGVVWHATNWFLAHLPDRRPEEPGV